ncbi:MAG TPA: zf-HC2 domain-containing protein [Thermomicrobiales bacterium]
MSATDEVLSLLPAYAADELAAVERERVERALAESPQLRDELARYQRLFVLLAALADEDVALGATAERRMLRQLAIGWYLGGVVRFVEGVASAYGRALVHYLGGGRAPRSQQGGR